MVSMSLNKLFFIWRAAKKINPEIRLQNDFAVQPNSSL